MNNLNSLSIPIEVVYVGLGGTLLALLVATIANKWSPKVFFLLALRLAIGWQFLFEGLYKVQTHYGPSDRPFSSEPYFRAAPGPVGGYMRRQFDDPSEVIAQKVKAPKNISPEVFAKMSHADQADACPAVVAEELNKQLESAEIYTKTEAEKQLKNIDPDLAKATKAIADAEDKALKEAKSDEEKTKAKAKAVAEEKKAREEAEEARTSAQKKLESYQIVAREQIAAAKASYARWVYGAEGRNTKVKFISGDVFLTAPERLAHIEWLRGELKAGEERLSVGLGNGNNIDSKRVAELRTESIAAESDLAKDANAFVNELTKSLTGKSPEESTHTSIGHKMDIATMWFLVCVGAFLMAGLFTRLSCLLAAGFLVMTYLAHPPFPWHPLPPNTEGNPLFINKNIIECLALLALACMPTGRWLGLDALVLRPFCRYKGEGSCSQPPPTAPPGGLKK
jgi:uncharacterized membrane protein YphA (DoxX/SURF4 family)